MVLRDHIGMIEEMRLNGASFATIGRRFGVSAQRVNQVLVSEGAGALCAVTPSVVRRSREREKLRRRYRPQMTSRQLADATGIPLYRINGMLRRLKLPYNKKRIAWSKEELLAHLQVLACRLGRTPTTADIDRVREETQRRHKRYVDHAPCVGPYLDHFGSLTNAQRAAGLVPNKRSFQQGHNRFGGRGNA